ncbi:MAG: transglutaminase-like domain-containing protein [Pikeienuella sp.]
MTGASGIAQIEVAVPAATEGARLLLPTGIGTPHDLVTGVSVSGAAIEGHLAAEGLRLGALLLRATGGPIHLTYAVGPGDGPYPEQAFRPRSNRHTRAAEDLATAARTIAAEAGGGLAAVAALVAEAEARFDYAHPEVRFTDGLDAVPYLSCGRVPGSCVDINTYLVASLRAAGIEAAYLYGYFFPEEKGGVTQDMHCWVATRLGGEVQEWDIAHHIKAGLGATQAGLNPRPGRRVALGHSMGHSYALPEGRLDLKLLAEPVWIEAGAARGIDGLTITAR